ncbi:hypothetical protein [Actinomadura terrae]|nr:hypothetical protein [Actinomadura terrae]
MTGPPVSGPFPCPSVLAAAAEPAARATTATAPERGATACEEGL